MILKDIYASSNYLTDEEMTTDQAISVANGAIAEINTKVKTNLPFYESKNYQEEDYIAFSNSWQMRLLEPYLSFAIATNDADISARDFHYNRFLAALSEFKTNGLDSILTEITDEDGNIIETGYGGNAKRVVKVDASDRINPFAGWWL